MTPGTPDRAGGAIPLTVACPDCGAEPGQPCTNETLQPRPAHADRLRAETAKRTSAPVGAGADAHAGGRPDVALLERAVAAALATPESARLAWRPGQPDTFHDDWRTVTAAALAAAGRVLAERLAAFAAERTGSADADLRLTAVGLMRAAEQVRRLCGVPATTGGEA